MSKIARFPKCSKVDTLQLESSELRQQNPKSLSQLKI